ncbi:MAG: hypothetical protein N3H30_02300, partial [Candidatus Micrarchaeota archaeon]|nr:hypothetical protein [Candidatus Micrarchaeota archaeon]
GEDQSFLFDYEWCGEAPNDGCVITLYATDLAGNENSSSVSITTTKCGDAVCDAGIGETCATCEADCGVCEFCGDSICNAGEDVYSCEQDCYACGDGVCSTTFGEDAVTCYADCKNCGDAVCDAGIGETCATCQADCGPCARCGDGICQADIGERCSTCPADCGSCGGGGGGGKPPQLRQFTMSYEFECAPDMLDITVGPLPDAVSAEALLFYKSEAGISGIDVGRQVGASTVGQDGKASFVVAYGGNYVLSLNKDGFSPEYYSLPLKDCIVEVLPEAEEKPEKPGEEETPSEGEGEGAGTEPEEKPFESLPPAKPGTTPEEKAVEEPFGIEMYRPAVPACLALMLLVPLALYAYWLRRYRSLTLQDALDYENMKAFAKWIITLGASEREELSEEDAKRLLR